jgi:hypothetical protein
MEAEYVEVDHQANASFDLLLDNNLVDRHCLYISDNSSELGEDLQIPVRQRPLCR